MKNARRLCLGILALSVSLSEAQAAGANGAGGVNFRAGSPAVATTYFYWYDMPTKAHVMTPDGRDVLSHHPVPFPDPNFSFNSVDWHARQLADMADAGIDIVLPDFWGTPGSPPEEWTIRGLDRLAEARDRLRAEGRPAPAIGMFFDTNTAKGKDLSTEEGRGWFYGVVRSFYRHVPPRHRALVDGRPLIFVYQIVQPAKVSEFLYPATRNAFQREFGAEPFLVSSRRQYVLDMKGDEPEVGPWLSRVRGNEGWSGVIAAMAASNESYTLAGNTPVAYVDALYRRILGRPADAPGRSVWVGKLAAGARRETVVQEMLGTDEAFRTVVARWYREFLERRQPVEALKADPGVGLLARRLGEAGPSWAGYVALLSAFLAGPDFAAVSGSHDEGFVEALYQKVLRRDPLKSNDPGKRTWVEALRTQPRAEVASRILSSDEAVRAWVAAGYHDYIGRYNPGEADGQFQWGGSLWPQILDIPSIGAGFEPGAFLRAGNAGLVPVDRRGGRFYEESWSRILEKSPRPWLVHVETWNEFHEGTDLCETREYGRRYIEMTRRFSDAFRRGR